ncbi:MAG: HNH endonuclease [Odoribacter sp.]|nr:HNH endonuclease [Odoribacter sp.]
MRSRKWDRDEIILALDLYFDKDIGVMSSSNPKIIELSDTLNRLPQNKGQRELNPKFRNPNGVQLKLSNFKAIDPSYSGTGMSSYSREDERVFNEFYLNRERLKKTARRIRTLISDDIYSLKVAKIEDDWDADDNHSEGGVLYKLHKYRERNRKIVKKKKEQALTKYGILQCETCGLIFKNKYELERNEYIECHHIVPLHESDVKRKTKLEDLILICSNCHVMIHRNKIYDIEEFKSHVKA